MTTHKRKHAARSRSHDFIKDFDCATMTSGRSGNIKLLFWGTIIMGAVLPIAVMVAVDLIFRRSDFLSAFISAISFFSGDLWGFLPWVIHNIPFIFLAFLIKLRIGKNAGDSEPYIIRLSEVIGAWILTVGFDLTMNIDMWISISGSMWAPLAYLFISFYEIITILVGYGGGWVVGKIIVGVRR